MNKKYDSLCKWLDYQERSLEPLTSIPLNSITSYAPQEQTSIPEKGKRFLSDVCGS